MADTQEVQIKITADTSGADKSVGSIKKQLREATADLLRMREQFGETSDEAIAAAKKVANLKDEIGDAKALINAAPAAINAVIATTNAPIGFAAVAAFHNL